MLASSWRYVTGNFATIRGSAHASRPARKSRGGAVRRGDRLGGAGDGALCSRLPGSFRGNRAAGSRGLIVLTFGVSLGLWGRLSDSVRSASFATGLPTGHDASHLFIETLATLLAIVSAPWTIERAIARWSTPHARVLTTLRPARRRPEVAREFLSGMAAGAVAGALGAWFVLRRDGGAQRPNQQEPAQGELDRPAG